MAIAGRVAIVPKGDWSADATYKRLDAVTYNNTLYFAKKEVPAGTATSNTEYWSKSIVGGVGAIATTEEAGIVKPDGKSMSVDESGTLSINLDGTTIALDEAKNVVKLADALKEKIGSALQPESIVNNLTATEAGFALDARQANPNVDGTLAKQVSDLSAGLAPSYANVSDKLDTEAANGIIEYTRIGRIVMLYFTLTFKKVSEISKILPAGSLPGACGYGYHYVSAWGNAAIAGTVMAVADDGSLAVWNHGTITESPIYDSFVYITT